MRHKKKPYNSTTWTLWERQTVCRYKYNLPRTDNGENISLFKAQVSSLLPIKIHQRNVLSHLENTENKIKKNLDLHIYIIQVIQISRNFIQEWAI